MNYIKLLIFSCILLFFGCLNEEPKKKVHKSEDLWTHYNSTNFKLHAQKEVRSETNLKSLASNMEAIQNELLRLLNQTEVQKLEFYFLKDRATLSSYTGYPANGYTDTEKGIIYFVDKDPFHLPLRHEIMHALSWRLWGHPKQLWISEGIAVFASGTCGGYNLHNLANALGREKKLIDFQKLTDSFDLRPLEPSLQAASMVKFIYELKGAEALRKVWKVGWMNVEAAVGLTPVELENAWKKHIGQEKFRDPVDWTQIRSAGCE